MLKQVRVLCSHLWLPEQDTNKTRFCVHDLPTMTFERRMKEKKKSCNLLIGKEFKLFCHRSAFLLSNRGGHEVSRMWF